MVEEDDAVRHVLLEAVAGEATVPLLAREHHGQPAILQPPEEPAQLGPQHGEVRQPSEQGLDRVEGDPLRADGVDGVLQPDEEPGQIVLAGLLDLAPLDADVVDRELPLRLQPADVEPERRHVRGEVRLALLERHEHAGLAVIERTADEELPDPAPPQTSVGRPRGRPPSVISSRPRMPDGAFARGASSRDLRVRDERPRDVRARTRVGVVVREGTRGESMPANLRLGEPSG
ncbi:MAG TPA: hypothetical protein VFK90_17085 [Anaeromyxobacter sp.]|nr:hypothetical protein [Anaeromyxobacter sp.]